VSASRLARVKRLLEIETQRVAVKERELAEAQQALQQAERRAQDAERDVRQADAKWLEAMTSADDLERASAHRRELVARVARANKEVESAATHVRVRQQAVVAARMGERRFEILIEGLQATETVRVNKAERKAADEHAARRAGAS